MPRTDIGTSATAGPQPARPSPMTAVPLGHPAARQRAGRGQRLVAASVFGVPAPSSARRSAVSSAWSAAPSTPIPSTPDRRRSGTVELAAARRFGAVSGPPRPATAPGRPADSPRPGRAGTGWAGVTPQRLALGAGALFVLTMGRDHRLRAADRATGGGQRRAATRAPGERAGRHRAAGPQHQPGAGQYRAAEHRASAPRTSHRSSSRPSSAARLAAGDQLRGPATPAPAPAVDRHRDRPDGVSPDRTSAAGREPARRPAPSASRLRRPTAAADAVRLSTSRKLERMCGIVGYVGPRSALEVVMQGLRRLEYRGYDSAGVAVIGDDGRLADRQEGRPDREPGRRTGARRDDR